MSTNEQRIKKGLNDASKAIQSLESSISNLKQKLDNLDKKDFESAVDLMKARNHYKQQITTQKQELCFMVSWRSSYQKQNLHTFFPDKSQEEEAPSFQVMEIR